VIKILDEPTAAAIAYGMDAGADADAKTLVVYDLGGGTFDISVLMMAGGTFAPLDLEGDMWLGGDNFDQVLIDHALDSLKRDYPDLDPKTNPRFMVELRKAAQKTKEALGASRSADLIVSSLLQDADHNLVDLDIEVTREEFERLITPLVERTTSLVQRALDNANVTPGQVDYVLMAGNSTGLLLVQSAMEKLFGADKVLRRIHPKECVAMGAALLAAALGQDKTVCVACGHLNDADAGQCAECREPLETAVRPAAKVTAATSETGEAGQVAATSEGAEPEGEISYEVTTVGVAPFAYGAQGVGDTMTVFVEKNDPYPTAAPRVHVFKTQTPNARIIAIPIYGGDDHEHAGANERQGDAFAILPPGLPARTPVRVSIWLDADGVFKLSAHLQGGQD
jgi:molecular chaperone DnaK